MFKRVTLSIALACTSVASSAAEITDFRLDNGLEVVVIEDHRAPVVVHMLWYKAGAADEPPGKSGIAHFLEHLMFKGTDTIGSGEFSEIVAANGGTDNAFTSQDYTGYFQRVAADRLGLMMELEADRMVNLRLDPAEVATELDVVIEERNQRTENDPGALFGEERTAAQFINHPYGDPIVGWRHEIESLTLEDARSFYEEHYAPNNAILIVAGDVEPDDVLAMAETHYGPIPANEAITERSRPQEPPQRSPRRLVYDDARVAQPYVVRTYLAPERDAGSQREAAALTLLSSVLGSGQTAVLSRKLQFETNESVHASAFYSGTNFDDTTFGLIMVPSAGVSLTDAEAALERALAEFMDEGVDAGQLERIKMQIRSGEIYGQDSLSGLARRVGTNLTSGLTIQDFNEWPDLLQSITADEIMAAAERVFDDTQSVTGWLTNSELSEATP